MLIIPCFGMNYLGESNPPDRAPSSVTYYWNTKLFLILAKMGVFGVPGVPSSLDYSSSSFVVWLILKTTKSFSFYVGFLVCVTADLSIFFSSGSEIDYDETDFSAFDLLLKVPLEFELRFDDYFMEKLSFENSMGLVYPGLFLPSCWNILLLGPYDIYFIRGNKFYELWCFKLTTTPSV